MAQNGLEGLLEIVGLEVMTEGVRAGTHSEGGVSITDIHCVQHIREHF